MDLHIKRANKITSKDWIFTSQDNTQVVVAHLVKEVAYRNNGNLLEITMEDGKKLLTNPSEFLLSA